jgi:hypothetical protein
MLVTSAGAALALGLSIGASYAVPIPTSGDPFPSGSELLETRAPAPFPFGLNSGCISVFSSHTLDTTAEGETFTYDNVVRTFAFTQNGKVTYYTFTGGVVQAEIVGRSSLDETGTFDIKLLKANWTGTIGGQTLDFRLDPTMPSGGTITFTTAADNSLLVDYNMSMYNQSGPPGNLQDTPVTMAVPRIGGGPPVVPVPEASTWAMVLVGFAGLGFACRRKMAGALRLV